MLFTNFAKLKLVVSEFGANPIVAELNKRLTEKGISVDDHADQVVIGENGIYYVDPAGELTKVIIHIIDNNVNSKYARGLKEAVQKGDFESAYVLEKVHKYHLTNCNTIERAEKEGWRKHRYHMSRNQDGHFFYRYIENNSVLIEKPDQLMYACKNCLSELGRVTGKIYKRETFDLEGFLSSSFKDMLGLEKTEKYANDCAPNVYQKDWDKISKTYRSLKGYQCEDPSCPSPDLSEQKYRKFLHVHHVSFDKTNNNYSNLKSLCIYCHSNQPNHVHVRDLPDYKRYIELRRLG